MQDYKTVCSGYDVPPWVTDTYTDSFRLAILIAQPAEIKSIQMPYLFLKVEVERAGFNSKFAETSLSKVTSAIKFS